MKVRANGGEEDNEKLWEGVSEKAGLPFYWERHSVVERWAKTGSTSTLTGQLNPGRPLGEMGGEHKGKKE